MAKDFADTAPKDQRAPVTREDMARLGAEDFRALQHIARSYCRTVDATRSRKRMDGSATVVRGGCTPYGTDDVSDDVTQDAVLIFAKRLRVIMSTCDVAAVWTESGEASAWQYVKRNGETIVVERQTMHYWAVRDAAARNGYRLDVRPDQMDSIPGAQIMSGLPHADSLASLAVVPYLNGNSEAIFKAAWGDGSEYPTLRRIRAIGGQARDLGREGVMERTAQDLHGGKRGSRRQVRRTRAAAKKEWQDLKARLDEVRDEMVYRSADSRRDR